MKSFSSIWFVAVAYGALCAFAVVSPAHAQSNSAAVSPGSSVASGSCPPMLDRTFKKLQDESDQSLCQYAGKVVVVVNTASYCGFTDQYKGLEELYAKYQDQGLVVLGFPSNDFSQEPDENKKIADFCYNTYGVKFPMFSKTSVVGANANPFFTALAQSTGKKPGWNFFKYVLDRNGKVVASYASPVGPTDRKFVGEIEKLLAQS
jgi:glutathione peroxidase